MAYIPISIMMVIMFLSAPFIAYGFKVLGVLALGSSFIFDYYIAKDELDE